ncbi:hypothetical protein [Kaistella sp.]|uniref:hypothetical protein n=1 Tax=Kaistella sp. TaxID=2782235 RepID=UPI002F924E46
MKKLFMLFAVGFSLMAFSQNVDQQKLTSILDVAKVSTNDPVKLDSLLSEALKLKETTDVAVRIALPQVIDVLRDGINSGYTAKPLKREFDNIDKDLQKFFYVNNDKFKKTSFITGKKVRSVGYNFYPYIAITDGIVRLRLVTKYAGRDWVFFKNVHFIIDGKDYKYNVEPETKVETGGVEERADNVVYENTLNLLQAIATGNDISYRLSGKYIADKKLFPIEKETVTKTLELYKLLTE